MAHYLLTGAAGFIASAVARQLLEQGHHVTGIDNENDAYDVRLKEWRLAQLRSRGHFHYHPVDIADYATLQKVWDAATSAGSPGPFDAVINLAARAGVRQSTENPWVYVDTNMTGTLNLLELCRHTNTQKFILASTSSLYGKHNVIPYSETDTTDRAPSPYAASKKGAEAMAHTYHELYGIDVTVFRYFTVYGPAGRPDMSVFRFIKWIAEEKPLLIYGDGSQSRDFTYVDDIASGTIAGLKPLGYEIINLGSNQPHGLMDMLHMIEAFLGKQANITYQTAHPADVKETWANVDKAHELLGWTPQVTLEEGIRRSVDWYRANADWLVDIAT